MRSLSSLAPASLRPARTASGATAAAAAAIGDWEVVGQLGQGEWMAVYQARPHHCPHDWPADYAVKVVRSDCAEPELAKALLAREVQVGRSISHAHVVTILTAQFEVHPAHLVMPHLAGCSLAEESKPGCAMNAGRAVWIARQAAEGLAALHQAGWIHADLKPANLHLSPLGHVTLVDLGLAHHPGEEFASAAHTLLGTLHYMAPERFTSLLVADERSDFYSLGVLLYEMLTGYLPYAATSPAGWAEAHRQAEPIDPRRYMPTLHPRVVRLLHRLLAKDPLRRPQCAAELVDRLVGLEIELFEELYS